MTFLFIYIYTKIAHLHNLTDGKIGKTDYCCEWYKFPILEEKNIVIPPIK